MLLSAVQNTCHGSVLETVSRWQPFDPGNIELRKGVANPCAGDNSIGCDLGEWYEHKGAPKQFRMRQSEPGFIKHNVVIA